MLIQKFVREFKNSISREEFVKLVKQKYPDRNIKTIQRDYYRINQLFVKGDRQGLGRKGVLVDKHELLSVAKRPTMVGSEWSSSQEVIGLSILKQIKLRDMKRYNIKLTTELLFKEGFTIEEIEKILSEEKNEKTTDSTV